MMTNSPVPMAKPPTPSASTARRKLTGAADEEEETEMSVSALSSAGGEAFKARLLGRCPAAAGRTRILG